MSKQLSTRSSMQTNPIVKEIILVGGGHSHALFLTKWAMKPIAGVRVTLISPQVMTVYSGMLPGLVAGHYQFDDVHIDLAKLCRFANARFIKHEVCGLQPKLNRVQLTARPALYYDVISFDTGGTPDLSVTGAAAFSTPVKPVNRFYQRWMRLLEQLKTQTDKQTHISVVGNGAGGIELILAMQHYLRQLNSSANVNFQLVARSVEVITGYPQRFQAKLRAMLARKNIDFVAQFDVEQVTKDQLYSTQQQTLKSDLTFWCTQVIGAHWLSATQLDLSEQGFIRVKPSLQSLHFPNVFACGDVSHFDASPLAKAGVYAVRMADTLFDNICALILDQPLVGYKPQRDFLSLLACGDKTALGARSGLTITGAWVWRLKDKIDRKFMAMLQQLPHTMDSTNGQQALPAKLALQLSKESMLPIADLAMRCGGCGAKVGFDILQLALSRITTVKRAEVVLGLDGADDAAIIDVPSDKHLVQTLDQFRSFIDDAYLFGQIAAEHALSDCYAMGAEPMSALASVTLPFAAEQVLSNELEQLMAGATQVLNAANCQLVGGHTAEGPEASLGFNINGLIDKGMALTKPGAQPQQLLIATKAIGTGVIFAADMRHQAKGVWVEQAIQSMLSSNRQAAQLIHDQNVYGKSISACTDITGFGLLGHLTEMLRGSGLGAELSLAQLPVLNGAQILFKQGFHSSLQGQNLRFQNQIVDHQAYDLHPRYSLLFDPQTSGGLLLSVTPDIAPQLIEKLHLAGYPSAAIIGRITALPAQGMVSLID